MLHWANKTFDGCEVAPNVRKARATVAALDTPERIAERVARGQALAASRLSNTTPEQRSEVARKAAASKSHEDMSASAKASYEARPQAWKDSFKFKPGRLSTEQLKARRAAQVASMTPEQRSEAMRKANAKLTPEQRRERALRAVATRRAKKAAAQLALPPLVDTPPDAAPSAS